MTEWPVLPDGWKTVSAGEQVTWRAEFGGEPRENDCRIYWGSHGCHRRRLHRGHHNCDPCGHHPWWLHAVLYWSAHLFKRSGLIDHWQGGCVERWPYYGRKTRFYGEDAP